MNREIKFRAWVHRWNRYAEVKELHAGGGVRVAVGKTGTQSRWIHPDVVDIEQFTGMHDSSGKEIYDGDIIELFSSIGTSSGLHRVAMETFGERDEDHYGYWWHGWLKIAKPGDKNKVVVVGNIHTLTLPERR